MQDDATHWTFRNETRRLPADPQPGSISTSTGIYDVKSGFDGNGTDGSRIADW